MSLAYECQSSQLLRRLLKMTWRDRFFKESYFTLSALKKQRMVLVILHRYIIDYTRLLLIHPDVATSFLDVVLQNYYRFYSAVEGKFALKYMYHKFIRFHNVNSSNSRSLQNDVVILAIRILYFTQHVLWCNYACSF